MNRNTSQRQDIADAIRNTDWIDVNDNPNLSHPAESIPLASNADDIKPPNILPPQKKVLKNESDITLLSGADTEYISAEAKQKKHANATQFRKIIAHTISSRNGVFSPQKNSAAGIIMKAACIDKSIRFDPNSFSSFPKIRYPAILPAIPKVATVWTVLTPWSSVCLRYTKVRGCIRNATIAIPIIYIENDVRQLFAVAAFSESRIRSLFFSSGGRSRKYVNSARANCRTAHTAIKI